MSSEKARAPREWFDNCGGFFPKHNLAELLHGIEEGWLNEQDEYGMTALSLAVSSGWLEGVEELLRAGADTELRYFHTGETALYMTTCSPQAMREKAIITALIKANANPDASNYWGITPRKWAARAGLSCFDHLPFGDSAVPPPYIQNAEHLQDHYPRFKIPSRRERENMEIGQAVDVYVYGPKSDTKQDQVKIRIIARIGEAASVRFVGTVETPLERTYLSGGTKELEFGPENIASVYITKPPRKTKKSL